MEMRGVDGWRLEVVRSAGESLPMQWREGPSYKGATVATLIGGGWVAFTLDWLVDVIRSPEEGLAEAAFVLVVLAFGLPFLLAGIDLFSRTFVRIDASGVRFRKTSPILPTKEWTEPLSGYRGVLPARRYRRGRKRQPARTELTVHLKHGSDRGRDVELFRASVRGQMDPGTAIEDEHRRKTEAFARLLGVPVLEEEEDGTFSSREVHELDASVRRRPREAGPHPSFDPAALADGSSLSVTRIPRGYAFEASLVRDFLGAAAVAALGLGLLYLYFGPGLPPGDGPDWIVPVVGAGFAAAGLFLARPLFRRVERLEVTPEGVRVGRVRAGSALGDPGSGADDVRSLPTDDIEEVAIRKNRYGRWRLTIAGDGGRLTWGRYVPEADRRRVRDAVLERLTE